MGDELTFTLFMVEEEDNTPLTIMRRSAEQAGRGLHQLCGAGDAGATV